MSDRYNIIIDEPELDAFLESLPPNGVDEVWYACLFGRHKYDESFPNNKQAGQLARIIAKDVSDLKEKIRRLESPIGSFSRDGVVATQQCLALYMAVNPRSLIKANKAILVELAKRFAEGDTNFNPVSLAHTEIHRAVDRKFYIDFDFDGVEVETHLPNIKEIIPAPEAYRILKTRGGFHLLVDIARVRELLNNPENYLSKQWHRDLSALPNCDVRGSDSLTPVPGCTQGGFVPHFVDS